MRGFRSGAKRRSDGLCPSVGWFVDERGYTSLAVALALLLSLTLVFAAAASTWAMSRSAEIQEVADAAALSGNNVVAAFTTTAQVLDACVLTLGLTGLAIMACSLVLACVPGLEAAAEAVLNAGREVLTLRGDFARSAARGLKTFEAVLPALVVANSASCVAANAGGTAYLGCAVPVPTTSNSDYGALEAIDDAREVGESAERLTELTKQSEEARKKAKDALERGWRADCGSPRSMWERADTLSVLSVSANPYYPSTQGWNFGVPLARARAYYAARYVSEKPLATDMESITDSCCRREFYSYALDQVRQGHYRENADGTVSLNLPSLPHNTQEVRLTSLYTTKSWPCTWENGERVLHSTHDCPNASGEDAGNASLLELEAGFVSRCLACEMTAVCMGKVAAASTSIDNGFEHWWREVVEASKDYEAAQNEYVKTQTEVRQEAQSASDLFEQALKKLSVVRPRISPPGAYGCVAIVVRPSGQGVPAGLTEAFLNSQSLPAGAAVSAATLAPDERTGDNNVLSRLTDGTGDGSVLAGIAGGATGLWGQLLSAYSSATEGIASVVEEVLDALDGVFGVGSWLKERIAGIVEATGLAPGDMRLKKPVLVSSQEVLAADGVDAKGRIREAVRTLVDTDSVAAMARSLGVAVVLEIFGETITVAEIPIPGTTLTIPLTIDLKSLAGSS